VNVYIDGKIHIGINAGAISTTPDRTVPQVVTYDVASKTFSNTVTLGESSSDHHDGPMIWADMNDKLHIFYGWHHDLGKHMISNNSADIGTSSSDWSAGTAPSSKMSYPWVTRCMGDKHLVFYRTDGHYSSWTYRITGDNGNSWTGPDDDLLDLDLLASDDGIWTDADTLMDWSLYTAKAISKDGNFLHVSFIAYDDYKRPRTEEEFNSGSLNPDRQENPLYANRRVSYDYNLYYIKVDLRDHQVTNFAGDIISTPITYQSATDSCMIWDTEWRGGSVIPFIMADENDDVSFVHNISDFQHEDSLDYHYVRYVNGEWKKTRITDSNHEWNASYLSKSNDGSLHAYVITGEGYNDLSGDMNNHGGGNIEEWISVDAGDTWEFSKDITPGNLNYAGWHYNNVQPVRKADGTIVDGLLLFYGWDSNNGEARNAKAFLYISSDEELPPNTISYVPITASEIDDNWIESSVTWANAPTIGSNISSVQVTSEGKYYEWDITSYVKTQIAGDRIISIALEDLAANKEIIEFYSKEAGGNIPELSIIAKENTLVGFSKLQLKEQVLNIYPNPLYGGLLNVSLNGFEEPGNVDITITNLQGQTVYKNSTQYRKNIKINTNGLLNNSIYFVSVIIGQSATTTKLIVQ